MFSVHFKTALDHIRRSPFQAMAAILVLTVTFFAVTILGVIVYSSEAVIKHYETRPQIIAFLDDTANEQEISFLQNKLTMDKRIQDVRYVTKEEALRIYQEATADNPLLSELVSPSIFPASIEVSVVDLAYAQEIIQNIKAEPVVKEVGLTATLESRDDALIDVVNRLKTVTLYLRLSGLVLVSFLVSTSFFVLLIIIGMRMMARKGEIEILKLIGATPGFIRSPILMEALIYSVIGTLLGWTLALLLVLYSSPALMDYFGEIRVLPRETLSLIKILGIILAAELIVAVFLALTGASLALSRVKKR
jgi:cell division transport system permease protein